ncbi:MAG: hypothetical protein HDQ87_04440 [Clostridia bacterium]|nr:hypothetical protein [Clostridia bacterium]MBD5559595.1 hypothetical protein [Clostridia bacterium]
MNQIKQTKNNITELSSELFEQNWELNADKYHRTAQDLIENWHQSIGKPRGFRFGRKLGIALVLVACIVMSSFLIAGIPELQGIALNVKSRLQDMLPSNDQMRTFPTLEEAEAAANFRLPILAYLPKGYKLHGDITLQKAGDDFIISATYVRGSDYLNICFENLTLHSTADPSQMYSQITYEVLEDSSERSVIISTQPPFSAEVLYDSLRVSIVGSAVTRAEMIRIVDGLQR